MLAKDEIIDAEGDTLSLVLERAQKTGDLPIFNASVDQVRRLSSDRDAHSMELAQTILKDANLSAKILRIANSPVYSRGIGKISSVSRAVVLMGFDTIRNLCVTLKLIESFEHDHPAIGMNQIVARAYISAGLARDIGIQCGSKDAEEIYICGLLHGLGEIAVANFLPARFNAAVCAHKDQGLTWHQAQDKILGIRFSEVGQQLAATWNFSSRITSTMLPFNPHHKGPLRNREELSHALAALGSDLVGKLFIDHTNEPNAMRDIMGTMSELTGLRLDKIENCLTQSFQASCELAKEYGLDSKVLLPTMHESGDDLRDRLAREFAFHASTQIAKKPVDVITTPTAAAEKLSASASITPSIGVGGERRANNSESDVTAINVGGRARTETDSILNNTPAFASNAETNAATPAAPVAIPALRGDPLIQLSIIQEITTMVTEGETLNKLLVKIIEGLQRGVGFERILLCLMAPDRNSYAGRIAMGKDTDGLRLAMTGRINESNNLFSKVLIEGADLLVPNITDGEWKGKLSPDIVKKLGTTSFILGGVRSGTKPIGFFYADNGTTQTPVTPEQRRGFSQFVMQARLAVQIRG